MKKFFITALTVVALTASAFASDVNKVSARAIQNFKSEFTEATNVEWTAKSNFSKATFTLDNQKFEAFYDYQGNMLATSHAIALDNLPTSAKRTFAKKYADYTVKEAIQFDTPDETAYYISAENEKQSVILKVSSGLVSVYQKKNKN